MIDWLTDWLINILSQLRVSLHVVICGQFYSQCLSGCVRTCNILFQNLEKLPRKITKIKTDLIDVDLVRGRFSHAIIFGTCVLHCFNIIDDHYGWMCSILKLKSLACECVCRLNISKGKAPTRKLGGFVCWIDTSGFLSTLYQMVLHYFYVHLPSLMLCNLHCMPMVIWNITCKS